MLMSNYWNPKKIVYHTALLVDITSTYLFFSALSKIITTGYKALSLMYFFTVGADEVKAWTIQVCYISRDVQRYIFYFKIRPLESVHTKLLAMALALAMQKLL